MSAAAKGLFPPLMGSASRQIEEQIYDYLAVVGPDLNTFGDRGFLPRLAESWKWSEDSLSIAFKINPRARWHDGIAADAADVRYTYAVYTNPAVGSPDASELTNIDSVTTPDSRTATLWYHRRSAYQLLDATQVLRAHGEDHIILRHDLARERTRPVIVEIDASLDPDEQRTVGRGSAFPRPGARARGRGCCAWCARSDGSG